MICACFCLRGTGESKIIDGMMNALMYQDILNKKLLKSLHLFQFENGFIFQQDNDPKHTSNQEMV